MDIVRQMVLNSDNNEGLSIVTYRDWIVLFFLVVNTQNVNHLRSFDRR
jgi:hypothetical protein